MARNDFPPRREAALVPFVANFGAKITASAATYSLTPAQAAGFEAKRLDFVAKWDACQDPATRTKLAVQRKDASKASMIADFRLLARVVQNALTTTTDAMRIDLGLPTRGRAASPIRPPAEKPVLEIVRVDGRRVTVRLRSADSDRRGRPPGVWAASVCSYTGTTPPADLAAWKVEGESTRTDFAVEFAASVPAGSQVWLTAFWKNPRLMAGPACDPVRVYLGGGLAQAA